MVVTMRGDVEEKRRRRGGFKENQVGFGVKQALCSFVWRSGWCSNG